MESSSLEHEKSRPPPRLPKKPPARATPLLEGVRISAHCPLTARRRAIKGVAKAGYGMYPATTTAETGPTKGKIIDEGAAKAQYTMYPASTTAETASNNSQQSKEAAARAKYTMYPAFTAP